MAKRPRRATPRRRRLASRLGGRRTDAGARRGQGVILTWDVENGANTVSFRGREYTNMPFLAPGNQIPNYEGGNIVVIDGWAPEGRLSSWCIMGRVFVPPVQAPEE